MNTTKKKISFLLLFLSLLSFNLKVVFASSLEGESKDSESSQFLPSDELLKNLDTEESLSETFGSSIISRSLQSGMVVSLVLFLLIFLSVVAWAIMIEKLIYLNYVQRKSRNFLDKFWGASSLSDLHTLSKNLPDSPAKQVFINGYDELVKSNQTQNSNLPASLWMGVSLDNFQRVLIKSKRQVKKQMENYVSYLAIIASVAPFIGLFGTVWGIMNSFEGIARSGNASLAAVAPGISEALIATAFGLAAAIPAVIGYNLAHSKIRSVLLDVENFNSDFLNIIERHLSLTHSSSEKNQQD